MPLLGRDKGRNPRSRRSDDEFVVFLQGIPAHCRWQELKDLVRQTALHIRQAVVYDDSHGSPTGLGQIIVKNEDEAWRTYHRLSTNGWEGQSLVVTLARTSAPTKPIAGPTRSPPATMRGYMSGHTTPPRSKDNGAMPPSPISPESIQSTSPIYPYADYTPMMGPVAMPPQHFVPMMPDPLVQPMQYFPPSPLMHYAMFDVPSWNMMPMYPLSPTNPHHESGRDGYPYQPRKHWATQTDASSPTPDLAKSVVYHQTLSPLATTAEMDGLLQGTGPVEQCNVTALSDAYNNQAQTQDSAIVHTVEEVERTATILNSLTMVDAQPRVNLDKRPNVTRSGSWDGKMVQVNSGLPDLVFSDNSSNFSEYGQDLPEQRPAGSSQPLVIDGSGMRKGPLDILSTSAPS